MYNTSLMAHLEGFVGVSCVCYWKRGGLEQTVARWGGSEREEGIDRQRDGVDKENSL